MPKARLIYDGDGDYIEKDRRVLQLTQEIQDKVDAIPGVVDDLTGTSSTDALSANMGRVLQEQINELSALGHFLSGWNASTGLPATNPRVDPYYYKTGDYYRVTAIGETNYKPHGGTYNQGVASTAVELDDVSIGDWYMYDGGVRILIKQGGSGGGGAYFKTQAEYDTLPASKESDGNLYIIVDNHAQIYTWEELENMGFQNASQILNEYPEDYARYYASTGDLTEFDYYEWFNEEHGPLNPLPEGKYVLRYNGQYNNCSISIYVSNLTESEISSVGFPSGYHFDDGRELVCGGMSY